MMVTAAVRVELARGVNVTLMVQLPPAETVPPQVVVSAKSAESVPVMAMLTPVKFVVPVLVKVMTCAGLVVPWFWLPKVRLVGERLTPGPSPVPVRLTVCVLPVTSLVLSVIINDAVRVPGSAGVNVTLIVQLPFGASVLPQVVVRVKSPESVPVTTWLAMVKVPVPVLLRVTVWAGLVVPTFWPVKVRLVAVRLATGAVAVPVRLTV